MTHQPDDTCDCIDAASWPVPSWRHDLDRADHRDRVVTEYLEAS